MPMKYMNLSFREPVRDRRRVELDLQRGHSGFMDFPLFFWTPICTAKGAMITR